MGKAPAFQFYPMDWLGDVELQTASSATRGIWINALCRMWFSRVKGELSGSQEALSKILNCSQRELETLLEENLALRFCYASRNDNGHITLRNRRMYRIEKDRNLNKLRQQKFRDKRQSNGEITPPSSTSSSSKEKETKKKKVFSPKSLSPQEYLGGLSADAEALAKKLSAFPQKPGRPWKTWEAIQHAINHRIHPRAIIEGLEALVIGWNRHENSIEKPWGYWRSVVLTKSGNYHEADYVSKAKVHSEDLKHLVDAVGGGSN